MEVDFIPMIPNTKIIKKIKETKSSIVWLGKATNSNDSNSYLIIKGIQKSSLSNNSRDFELLKRERNFLEENKNETNNPQNLFPKFIHAHKDDEYLYMILSLIEGLDFSTLILDKVFNFNKFESFDDFKIKKKIFLHFVSQIIQLLSILHSRKIIYRDLKMNNLIIDKKLKLHLVDFGTIKKLKNSDDRTSTICGTYHIMAPEIFHLKFKNSFDYDMKVDVYSLGVFIYELFSGMPPFDYLWEFDEISVKNYADLVCQGLKYFHFGEKFWKGCDYLEQNDENIKEMQSFKDNLISILKSCLMVDPLNRANLDELKSNQIFEDKFESYLDVDNVNFFNFYVEKIVHYIDFNGEFVECYERLEKEGDVFSKFF